MKRRKSSPLDVAEPVADTMFALSNPHRVQILLHLLDGPMAVGQLMEALGMEQSAVSHQLRVLREHTLVSATNVGRQRVYELYDDHVVALLRSAVQHVHDRASGARQRRGDTPTPDGRAMRTGGHSSA